MMPVATEKTWGWTCDICPYVGTMDYADKAEAEAAAERHADHEHDGDLCILDVFPIDPATPRTAP